MERGIATASSIACPNERASSASAEKLLPSEKKKLEKIGEILKEFSNDLLITFPQK